MAIKGYFFNAEQDESGDYDREYNSDDFCSYLDLLVGNGVFPIPSTNLQVLANNTMGVVVKKGQGWINGHKIVNTADMLLSLSTSDVTLSRIDIVVLYVDFVTREAGIKIKEGIEAITPEKPTLTRDINIYEMCLAEIAVNKQVTSISQSNIRDTRGLSDLCGWVQGLINQLDTQTLFTQWNAAYDEAITNDQSAFDEWFGHIKENFSTSTLLREYKKVISINDPEQTTFDIDINQFIPEIDTFIVYLNGMRLTSSEYTYTQKQVTLTNKVNTDIGISNVLELVVYHQVDGSDAITLVQEVEELKEKVARLESMSSVSD